jgi:hypothetical protein
METSKVLKASFPQLILGRIDFGELEIKFKLSSKMTDPAQSESVRQLNDAFASLTLI